MIPGAFFELPKFLKKNHDKKKNLVHLGGNTRKRRATDDSFYTTGELCKGNETRFAVGNKDIVLDDSTWVFGELRLGAMVRVVGDHYGTWVQARKVIIKN